MSYQFETFQTNMFAGACADEIIAALGDFSGEGRRVSFVLSGGGTPVTIFKTMTVPPRSGEVEWENIDFFFGDERFVPSDDPQSNFKMASETLLQPLKIKEEQVFKVNTSLSSPEESAKEYEERIKNYLSAQEGNSFDLLLLGMGDDGHTASLFPGSELLKRKGAAGAAHHPQSGTHRVSLLPEVILTSKKILVLVKGKEKAEVIREVFEGNSKYPISILEGAKERVTWLLDTEAASALER